MPNLVAVRRSCRKGGGYRQTEKTAALYSIIQAYYIFINNTFFYVHCILLSALSGATGPIDLKFTGPQKISVQHGLIRSMRPLLFHSIFTLNTRPALTLSPENNITCNL